ncbi:hypothetical protein Afil01_51810 [Actinorhabdospora filicis]|uniref:GatB/YqeY domain-containing protein n=1 Tax=Actinorhabdospora filicis TaxID=1785913 RepID=A0A9W6WB81_9ACTN|nr:GatB/YqeY domain-containing protein [Actinorhabdospora filicis]GLZ80374.1 hypothetical protein Afil01_51810 [Actinorhabdospora filicis]
MSTSKGQLETDLHTAMKARDELTTSTLRMALTAIRVAEVAGKTARELSDDEIRQVLLKEAKKRREAAEAFADAGRTEKAELELAEEGVLLRYLPAPLTEDELAALVATTIAEGGFTGMGSMGQAMKAVQAAVAGRADGKAVSALVRAKLQEG